MKHFWLIQRGSFCDVKAATEFLDRSSGLIDLDYMGAAEFEWGAIPKAYRRIMGQYEKYRLHITDLVTTGGVPFCLYCMDDKYEQIFNEIKAYLEKPYQLKEHTNMEAHFTAGHPLGADFHKRQLAINFWWCIDYNRYDEDVGDWIAFIGATDRQDAFNRVINKDFTGWWIKKSPEDRDKDFQDSFRW